MKKIKTIGPGLIFIFVLSLSLYLVDRFSYSKDQPYYELNNVKQYTLLTIGIIGDSWVTGNQLDSILHANLLSNGFNSKIISSGQPAAKSKLIYQDLFKAKNQDYSSRFLIENRPDYCIVIAGVNEAVSQIGSHFYSHHIIQIIKTLLHYKIKPVIVSLPEFGINKTIENENILGRYRNVISAYFNNHGEIDNIKTYRAVLYNELKTENLVNSVILIDYDKVCVNYDKCIDLYRNPSHLSEKGKERLIYVITSELINNISSPKR